MYASAIRVCAGLSLVEWAVAAVGPGPPVGANRIGYRSTVLPNLVFAAGLLRPSALHALSLAGIGCALDLLTAHPASRSLAVWLRGGVASLAATLYGSSPAGPVFALAAWCMASVGLSRRPAAQPTAKPTPRADSPKPWYSLLLEPKAVLPALVMSVSLWFGRWAASSELSLNEYFIVGVSMVSSGLMCSYAFPASCPYSQAYWTPSFALSTSGLSMLRLVAVQVACDAVHRTGVGLGMLSVLDALGTHAAGFFVLERGLALLRARRKPCTEERGRAATLLTAALEVAALVACAALVSRLST